MPLRTLLRLLTNNEQLIQKLAESYPIRRAAQLTAFFMHKGKELGEDGVERVKESYEASRLKDEVRYTKSRLEDTPRKATEKMSRFASSFLEELEKGWKTEQKKLKDKTKSD